MTSVAEALRRTRHGKLKYETDFSWLQGALISLDLKDDSFDREPIVTKNSVVKPKTVATQNVINFTSPGNYVSKLVPEMEEEKTYEPGLSPPERALAIFNKQWQCEAQRCVEQKLWELKEKWNKHRKMFDANDDVDTSKELVSIDKSLSYDAILKPNLGSLETEVVLETEEPFEYRASDEFETDFDSNGLITPDSRSDVSLIETVVSVLGSTQHIHNENQLESIHTEHEHYDDECKPERGVEHVENPIPVPHVLEDEDHIEQDVHVDQDDVDDHISTEKCIADTDPEPEVVESVPDLVRKGLVSTEGYSMFTRRLEKLNGIHEAMDTLQGAHKTSLTRLHLFIVKEVNGIRPSTVNEKQTRLSKLLHGGPVLPNGTRANSPILTEACMLILAKQIEKLSESGQSDEILTCLVHLASNLSVEFSRFQEIMLCVLQNGHASTVPLLIQDKKEDLLQLPQAAIFYGRYLMFLHRKKQDWAFRTCWQYIADILNLNVVPDYSAIVLAMILKECGPDLRKVYGKQFLRLLMCIETQLLPQLFNISKKHSTSSVKVLQQEVSKLQDRRRFS